MASEYIMTPQGAHGHAHWHPEHGLGLHSDTTFRVTRAYFTLKFFGGLHAASALVPKFRVRAFGLRLIMHRRVPYSETLSHHQASFFFSAGALTCPMLH
jgi:hypothetical protein